MKNFLAPVMKNKVVSKVTSEVSKFYVAHESTILTGGTIGFSLATTAVTYKNSAEINRILEETREALYSADSEDEKKLIYKTTLKALAPLVLPILAFQAATIGCALYSKRQSDKKLAAAAGALSIAQEAIARYQQFQKDAQEALGEKKYAKLQNDIYKNQEVDGRRFTDVASEGAPGEVLIIDKYSGRPFWCTTGRIEMAAWEMKRRLSPDGGYDQLSINDLYDLIDNKDLTPNDLGGKFGYVSGSDWENDISAHFADTHYVFPNGTRIPAFEMFLYPEPAFLDWEG
jgi:hypothetical protein